MNAQPFRLTLAVLLAGAVAACSGTAPQSLPNAPAAAANAPGHVSKKHKIKAKIRITIPKRKHHRRVKVRGHYISPATQSIAIAITPSSGPAIDENADLTAASNPGDCTQSLVSPLICTVTLTLDPGSYTASFTTYDGLLQSPGDADSPPTGHPLSANQSVPLSIAAGQANQINVALDGIPAGVVLVPSANSTLFGSAAAGFGANKCGSIHGNAEQVSVYGVDADGNYILGAGTPVPSLTSNSAVIVVSTPAPSSPNTFTLTHPISSTSQGPVPITFAVTPSADSGATVQSNSTNVGIAGGTQICGILTEYTLPNTSAGPEGITSGPDGNLWFTEFNTGKIGSITTSGTITEYSTGNSLSGPYDITAGHNNELWFTETAGGIGSSTTAGVVTSFTTGLSGTKPQGITVDATDTPWFTECGTNSIANLSGGVVSTFSAGPNTPHPDGITLGSDGNFWYGQQNGNVGKATPAGTLTQYPLPSGGAAMRIAPGAGGDLWFGEGGTGVIGRITTAGTVTEYPIPSNTGTFDVTLGPDGNTWFTEQFGGSIGSATTGGVVTEFDISFTSQIGFITAGPDGAMWFTESTAGKIGKLQ
jgi:streptogramin lyase